MKKDSRTLIIGIVACSGIAAIGRMAPRWREWSDAARNREELSITSLDEQRQMLSALPQVRNAVARTHDTVVAMDSLLLGNLPEAQALTLLAGLVSEAARDANVRIASMQLRSDTGHKDAIKVIRVRMNGVGDIKGLTEFLTTIEGGSPLLVVREMTASHSENMPGDDRVEEIRIDAIIEGLARMPELVARSRKSP